MTWASDGHMCVLAEEVDIFWSEPLANEIQEIEQESIRVGHQLQNCHKILHHVNLMWHFGSIWKTKWVSPLNEETASSDQFVPDAPALKDVLGHLMSLGKTDCGLEVKVWQELLYQLRSLPKLDTGRFAAHCFPVTA